MTKQKLLALFVPAAIVVAIDQLTKWIIRTSPETHRLDIIDGWLSFYYTQNSGMAMGIDLLSTPVISSISILATIGIIIYLIYSMDKAGIGYLIFMGLIIGGALGNISDRLFMGLIEGYGGVLHGHVVDFIHFNLEIKGTPVFPYIFNFADIAISVSIVTLLLFSKKLFPHDEKPADSEEIFEGTEVNDFTSTLAKPELTEEGEGEVKPEA